MLLFMLTAHSIHGTGIHLAVCIYYVCKCNLKYPSNYVQEEDFLKLKLCWCAVFVIELQTMEECVYIAIV